MPQSLSQNYRCSCRFPHDVLRGDIADLRSPPTFMVTAPTLAGIA
jgi:hypothetical protein